MIAACGPRTTFVGKMHSVKDILHLYQCKEGKAKSN
jgi:hypothetical protein